MEIVLFGKFKTLLCYLTLGLDPIVSQGPNALELFDKRKKQDFVRIVFLRNDRCVGLYFVHFVGFVIA